MSKAAAKVALVSAVLLGAALGTNSWRTFSASGKSGNRWNTGSSKQYYGLTQVSKCVLRKPKKQATYWACRKHSLQEIVREAKREIRSIKRDARQEPTMKKFVGVAERQHKKLRQVQLYGLLLSIVGLVMLLLVFASSILLFVYDHLPLTPQRWVKILAGWPTLLVSVVLVVLAILFVTSIKIPDLEKMRTDYNVSFILGYSFYLFVASILGSCVLAYFALKGKTRNDGHPTEE